MSNVKKKCQMSLRLNFCRSVGLEAVWDLGSVSQFAKIFTIITICCLRFKTCNFSFNSLDKYGLTDVGFIFENGLNSNPS